MRGRLVGADLVLAFPDGYEFHLEVGVGVHPGWSAGDDDVLHGVGAYDVLDNFVEAEPRCCENRLPESNRARLPDV